MKKALITGISGFAGSHLAELLISKNIEVTGFAHPKHPKDNLKVILSKINLVFCDLLDKKLVESFFMKNQFDYVFHLAAFSSPSQSFEIPAKTLENNIIAQVNILEGLVSSKSKAKILIVGSADEYGNVDPKYLPITEETPFRPSSPYAVSKITQDMLGLQYFLHNRLNIVRVRPFNHIGPRQSKAFVIPAFASQIALLEKKGGNVIRVGNLDSWRDFTDVRDMVKAYLLVVEVGIIGDVYNLGSGTLYRIGDILDKLIKLSKIKINIEVDEEKVRKTDIIKIYCDYSKFKKLTGWEPLISTDTSLFDTLEYERSQVLN